jgi:predicted dehydrogenase
MEKPIRIGIIGLSAKGGWAVFAHLPYLRKSSKYTITAICNTSLESSKAAVKAYGLPETTKAYGSPQELADDADVDLVLCTVNVAYHYESLLPALKAGKDVYCEWPLGKNLAEAEEMCRMAKEKGCKTMVGLQGQRSPIVAKLKEVIDQGKIGNVLSSTFTGPAMFIGPEEQQNKEYFLKAAVGGNMVTIFFGHTIETVISTLGELKSFSSILDIKVPTAELTDKPTSDPSRKVVRTVKRETHDQVLLQGHFESGALLSYHLHGGKPIGPGEGLNWRILGEKGEVSVTASGTWLQCGYPDSKIRLFDNRSEKIEEILIPQDEWDNLPLPAQNVARLYEAFADGRTDEFPDWSHAIQRHKMIDEMYSKERAGKQDQKAQYTNA